VSMPECEHITLRANWMPCPHPVCSSQPFIRRHKLDPPDPGALLPPWYRVETYVREKLEVGGSVFYAWHEVDETGPTQVRSTLPIVPFRP